MREGYAVTDGDEIVRCLSRDGSVSLRVLIGTAMVTDATSRHAMSPTARAALGRGLLGAVLLAVGGKDSESVQLEFRGDGPLRSMVAMSDPRGRARGYVASPSAHLPLRRGKLDIAGAIGLGLLTVSRRRPGWREAHSGTVALATSEVAQDLTQYLAESEQIPSALGLAAEVDGRGGISVAGGFLVQVLPGADDAIVERVESNVRSIPSTSQLLVAGERADALLDRLLEGVGGGERSRETPSFHCPCSRTRAFRTLSLLPPEDLRENVDRAEPQEVRCQFCGESYEFGPDQLGALLEGRADGKPAETIRK